MSTTTNGREIPLNKLVLWKGNVRKTGRETGLDELAASIEAHGLLNPLTVATGPKGKFCVVAGGRRLAALQALAKAGKLAKTVKVSCTLTDDEIDATEVSLAENVARVAMHPADQFEAWRTLIEDGAEVEQIAARFGVLASTVRKRLALSRVSPVIFEAYRAEKIGLEALQAFTVTEDHALQESVWSGLSGWQCDDARHIRRRLTETDVPSHDRRVIFVGLDAYEAAGGAVKRDLFDPQGGGFCQDAALLDRLALEKLEAVAQEVSGEGWAWTEARLSFPWDERQTFGQADMIAREATPEEEAEIERLTQEYGGLDEDAQERADEIDTRLDAIRQDREAFPDEAKAYAGAMVTLSGQGEAVIERGLIREGDASEVDGLEDDADGMVPDGQEDAGTKPPALSAALIEDLTAHKTAALRIELARSPKTALALAVYSVALSAFYHGGQNVLNLHLTRRYLERSMQGHDTCPAVVALEAERERICDRLPGQEADLWAWCLSARRDDLLDVLAVACAYGVDAVVSKAEPNRGGVAFGKGLAEALKLDMTRWWQPTAAGYFSRVPKAVLLADLEAAKDVPPAPSWEKMKKADLAALAERETAGTFWKPEPLR